MADAGSGKGAPTVGEVFLPVLELVARLAGDDAMIIGLEDLHWADTSTWDLFELLARNLFDEHVVLIGTFRATRLPPTRRNADGSPSSPGFPPCTGSISKASAVTRSPPASRP